MREALTIIAGLLMISSSVPYIIDTIRGKTHPNIVSWSTWTLLNVINAFAAYNGGSTEAAIFAAASAIGTGSIMLAGLRYGVYKYTKFDVICQIMALVGVGLWQLTNDPALAIGLNIVADFIAFMPSMRHAWRSPFQETWQAFVIGIASAIVSVFSLKVFTFTSLAFAVYIVLANGLFVAIILYRRRRQPLVA